MSSNYFQFQQIFGIFYGQKSEQIVSDQFITSFEKLEQCNLVIK